ncbi:MAG: ATP-binding cassette domain-containing protein [Chitinivibrionales bacterium]|nr:ATP-binding cassette domain-containing protein [Chitinivibrionales bacterium]
MIEVENLNKQFGSVQAVKNASFQIQKGEVLGFLGPNGAGKTTTMRIITCFIPATTGKIRIDGLDIHEHDLEVRKKIGYLPENAPLYNDMTVDEYMRFVAEIRGLSGDALDSRIKEMYLVCGLAKMSQRQIGKLSKGYRQRVGLAQAMIHNPDILILDEPMSGLDPNQIVEIRQLIKRLGEKITVIYCSHILSEVSATCSRILIINNGSIVASGTPAELTAKAGSGKRYFMTVQADRNALESNLPQVEGVTNLTLNETGGGWFEAAVFLDTEQEIGDKLFKCAVDNGWTLSELKRETASLEDVFTRLTRGE